ncbi:hypothetical protein [Thermopolyspora flexuosa]|uniref:hypothetical protein n=1 Tax=Thermopolyspora flexuosa TaxID=103836 RepID=UPI00114E8D0F|nr:hypothetical protein [Thermopolyspora flexuosa]
MESTRPVRSENDEIERRKPMRLIPVLGIHAVRPDVLNRVFDAADKSIGGDPERSRRVGMGRNERWHRYTTCRPGEALPMLTTALLQVTGPLEKRRRSRRPVPANGTMNSRVDTVPLGHGSPTVEDGRNGQWDVLAKRGA